MASEAPYSVYIKCYDDLDLLRGAVESIPDDVTVYVVDGRYADFPGDTLRTPGCRAFCEEEPNVAYLTPPDDKLPWGHEHVDEEPRLRWPIHEQAKWANYEALPQDEWILHMDADERLQHVDRTLFQGVRQGYKYVPYIDSLAERGIIVPRLYRPADWTFWIAGVMYPREFWGRDTHPRKLRELHIASGVHQTINRVRVFDHLRIHNRGAERPPEYHERRADQLETMGRRRRAQEYREQVAERRADQQPDQQPADHQPADQEHADHQA